MGFFQKIIDGLRKTKQQIGFKLNELFKRGIFDEDFYEELEYILLSSDVGEETTEDVIDTLRENMRKDSVSIPKKPTNTSKRCSRTFWERKNFPSIPPASSPWRG